MYKKIYDSLSKYFDIIETVLVILFAITVTILTREIKYSIIAVSVSSILLAFLYWIMSFESRNENDSKFKYYSGKFTWIALAVAVLGILLKFQFDEKSEMMLFVSILVLIISIILNIVLKIKEKAKVKPAVYVRALIYILVCLFLYSL